MRPGKGLIYMDPRFPVIPGVSMYFRIFPPNEEKKMRRRITANNRSKKPVKTECSQKRRLKMPVKTLSDAFRRLPTLGEADEMPADRRRRDDG